MQVKKQQLELDMEQQTGSKFGKEYINAIYCHLAYLTYMESTSCKMPVWIKQQAGIKIAGRSINNLRYADDMTLMAESEELESLLVKVKEESEKAGLNLNIQKTNIMASPFSQIIPPSPSPTESKRQFYTSVSLLLSRIQGYSYHLSKFHIYT